MSYRFGSNMWYGGRRDTRYAKMALYRYNNRVALVRGPILSWHTLIGHLVNNKIVPHMIISLSNKKLFYLTLIFLKNRKKSKSHFLVLRQVV